MVATIGLAAPAAAQSGVAGRPLKVCVLRDTGGMRAAELIRHPERFDCTSEQTRLGAGDYWAISEDIGIRSRSREPLNLRLASLWQRRISLHVLYDDGRMVSSGTDMRGVTPLVQLGAVVEQPLPRRGAKVMRALWHVEASANMRGILVGARLATAAQSNSANLRLAAGYSAFAGLCVALIMYNLALWVALRHRFHLIYCAMGACLLGYTFSSSGVLAWAFPDIINNDRLRINHLMLALSASTALLFARNFFEARLFTGWLGRYIHVFAGTIAAAGLLFFVASPFAVRSLDAIFNGVLLLLVTVVVPTLWRAWKLRSNFLWLFALGWGAPLIGAVLRVMANLNLIGWNFWIDNSTIITMAAEMTMSALAIAYRMKLLREERDDAIASEVMARRLADTDPLTGLLNRRAFLHQAIGREGEQSLLLADLDHFKRVNETLGHDGGDEVLRLFARLLRANLPPGSLVARMGGEEFAILADAATPVEPDSLLARLRATRMPFDLTVTASIGACRGTLSDDRDWKRLYRGADAALFAAKSAGRDRVRHAAREAA